MTEAFNLQFIKVLDNYIILKVLPSDFEVKKENIILTHIYDLDNDFTVTKIDVIENIYKLSFTRNINISDMINIYLKDNDILSNKVFIYMSRLFWDESSVFQITPPIASSGEYSISLASVNDISLDNVKQTFVYCHGIDTSASSISTNDISHSAGETVNFNINLLDSKSKKAPNGNYIIKIRIEQQ